MKHARRRTLRSSAAVLLAAHSFVEALEGRVLLSYAPPADPRVVTNLDASWKFLRADAAGANASNFDDSAWSAVSVPHTWNATDGQDGGGNYYRGIGWYRKHVTPAATNAGKRIYLKFDGANLTTDLYVNGTFVGQHKGGYSAFGWDVTSLLTVGADNVLAVKISNAADNNVAPLGGDYTQYGGIYRDVNLIATDPSHVAVQEFVPADTSPTPVGPTVGYWVNTPGVYLKPTSVSSVSANLQVKTDVFNEAASARSLTVISDLVDAAGNLVTELTTTQSVAPGANVNFIQNTAVTNPHLWNGVSDPYLYHVYTIVREGATLLDVTQQPLGFRSFAVTAAGATLNGQPYDLHGVNFHQDRLNKGWAISDADQAQDIALIKEIGATFVRLSHYQHPTLTYDLLDQEGIASWSEIPINGTNNNGVTSTTAFLDNAKQQLQEMMRQMYNHPSILVWGLYNELNNNGATTSAVQALNALAHQEDPTRPTTGATNQGPSAAVSNAADLMAFNRYDGWYSGTYNDIGPYLDGVHSSSPNLPIGLGEYGAGGSINQHQENPTSVNASGSPHPEEYQNQFHEAFWKQIKARPYMWSKLIWNMFDFAADGRNEGDTAGRNDKGMVTYDRATKKDSFYWYKANWSADPTIYITSRRFTTRTAPKTDIKIYSNLDNVTLTLNGNVIGTLTAANNPDHIFKWPNMQFRSGDNVVLVSGTRNGVTYTDTVTWHWNGLAQLPALTGTPFARINFEPAASALFPGYLADVGSVFGPRSGGLSYGWNADNTANTRDRTGTAILQTPPDARYATFIHSNRNGSFAWEIAVPNGTYDVHLVAGDAGFVDSSHVYDLEGLVALAGTPSSNSPWVESIVRVNVTDGRLTLSNDASGANQKIDYIDINTADGTPPSISTAALSMTGGPQSLSFTFSENVKNSLSDADLVLTNNTTGQDMPVANLHLLPYDVVNNIATFTFSYPNGVLPSGSYTARFADGGVTDDAGNALPPGDALRFVYVNGAGAADNIYAKLDDATHTILQVWQNVSLSGAPSYTATIAGLGGFSIDGFDGNDTLTLDFTNGDVRPAGANRFGWTLGAGQETLNLVGNTSWTFATDPAAGVGAAAIPHLTLGLSAGANASITAPSSHWEALNIGNAGRASLAGGGARVLTTKTLALVGSGQLDLADNDLIVTNTDAATIRNYVTSAYNFGGWDGAGGIFSSAARDNPTGNTTLGQLSGQEFADNNGGTFDGYLPNNSDVLVKYTYFGDVDFNGQVDVSDYNLVDFGFSNHLSGWAWGDADYSGGATDVSDYNLIDFAFATQSAAL